MSSAIMRQIFLCFLIVSTSKGMISTNQTLTYSPMEEQISIKVLSNPDCSTPACRNMSTLFYDVVITSETNSLHILLPNVSILTPASILMIEAGPRAKLHVNWTQLSDTFNGTNWHNSISIPEPTSSYGIVFNQFCPYNDNNDSVVKNSLMLIHDCHQLFGRNLVTTTKMHENPEAVNFIYTSTGTKEPFPSFDQNSKILINITIPKIKLIDFKDMSLTPGRGLIFAITIENLLVEKPTRFALIVLPFSKHRMQDDEDYLETLSISKFDDTVMHNLHLANIEKGKSASTSTVDTPAFMQWRGYCSASPDGSQRRQVHTGTRVLVQKLASKKYMHALPYLFYGDDFNQKHSEVQDQGVGIRVQPIFLGTPRDGFYEETKFIKWQSVLSMDEPDAGSIDEGLGKLVAIAITIPVFLIATAATVVLALVYKRRKKEERAAAGDSEDEVPILSVGDVGGHNSRAPRIVLPCGGLLRFCQQIPSPNLPVREEQVEGSSLFHDIN